VQRIFVYLSDDGRRLILIFTEGLTVGKMSTKDCHAS
jgi:hypothetical protein